MVSKIKITRWGKGVSVEVEAGTPAKAAELFRATIELVKNIPGYEQRYESQDPKPRTLLVTDEIITMMMPLVEYAPSRIRDALDVPIEEVEKALVALVKEGKIEQAGRNFRVYNK